MSRDLVTTGLEVAGFACLAVAGFTFGLTVGLIVTGLCLLAVGFLAGR